MPLSISGGPLAGPPTPPQAAQNVKVINNVGAALPPSTRSIATSTPAAATPSSPSDISRVTQINTLARTLGADFDVHVQSGAAWSYDPVARTLTCPTAELLTHDDADNIGAVCREISRLRYGGTEPAAIQAAPQQHYLWNVVEAIRCGKLMTERYSGAAHFLKHVYCRGDLSMGDAPPWVQFGEGCLARWLGDQAPSIPLSAPVQKALAQLGPLIDNIVRPPDGVNLLFDDLSREESTTAAAAANQRVTYELLPALAQILPPDAPPPPPPPKDKPPNGESKKEDENATNDKPSDSQGSKRAPPDAQSPEPQTPSPEAPPATPEASTARGDGLLQQAIARLLPRSCQVSDAAILDTGERPIAPQAANPIGIEAGHDYTRVEAAPEVIDLEDSLAPIRLGRNLYESLCAKYRAQIDTMESELERAFEARRHPRYEGYFKSGTFCLQRAIQARFRQRATGVRDTRLFLRRQAPNNYRAGFILVVDVSGSMISGGRIDHVREGTVVLLEPARRLQLNVGIISYNSTPCVLKQPTDDLSQAACARLIEHMVPRGSNNETAALRCARAMACDMDDDDIYILFFTDGGGDPSVREQIGDIQAEDPRIHIIGIGIGDDSAAVSQLYGSRSLWVRNIEALPEQLADVFMQLQSDAMPAHEDMLR